MKKRLLLCAALIIMVAAAHAPALQAGFVWDDTALVLRDPLIRSWRLIPEGFQHFLFTDATVSNFYRPLQRITYTFEYWTFAFQPSVYHITNVLLHVAAAIALFVFLIGLLELYRITQARWIAFLAAAAWALHPVHSAVVDYIAGRADSLAAIFGFTGLYLAIRSMRTDVRRPWVCHVLGGAMLLASALSKETGLIFAILYLILIALQKRWRSLMPAITAIAFVGTTYFTLRSQPDHVTVPQLTAPPPALVRPIIVTRALAEYTSLLIAPVSLHMERDVESHPWGFSDASIAANAWRELETVAGIVLLALLLLWLWRSKKASPSVFALLVLATIAYVPISGCFSLNATIAEHWLYLPSAFVLAALILQTAQAVSEKRGWHRSLVGVAALWITLLGVRSLCRAQDWTDDRTFFERTISTGGDSARMLINLGSLEIREGHLDRADELVRRALAREPEQPFALLNAAVVAMKRNDLSRARDLINRAEGHPATCAQARETMAVLENKISGRIDLRRLRFASRSQSRSWGITRRYLRALDQAGETRMAVAELQALLQTEWYRAESWQLLSGYLVELGRPREAAEASACAHELDLHLSGETRG